MIASKERHPWLTWTVVVALVPGLLALHPSLAGAQTAPPTPAPAANAPAETKPTGPPVLPGESVAPEPVDNETPRRRTLVIVTIVGAATMALGIALGVAARTQYNSFDDQVKAQFGNKALGAGVAPSPQLIDVRNRGDRLMSAAIVIGTVGFATLDVAAILFLTRRTSEKSRVSVVPTPDGVRAAWKLSF